MGQGSNLGAARGSITIDTSQAERVPGILSGVAHKSAQSMGALDAAANKNAKSLAALQSVALTASQALNVAISRAIQFANAAGPASVAAQSWAANLQKVATAGMSASAGLNAAIAAAAKASNIKYLSANTTPVFAPQGGGGLGGVANALGFGGGVAGIAGGLGIATGAAAIVQMGKAVAAAGELATAYDRQGIAAANLAGSQGQLNKLMEVYDEATGGIVDKASALQNVTKLMAVGFADSEQELDKFATAIRGISIAMGQTQDMVTQNLILELFTQRGMRLDQLGLQYDKVKVRAGELQAADSSLTDQMAYQNAVLEQAIERFGGLAESAEGAGTGMEKAARAWTNLNLKMGQVAQWPLDKIGGGFELIFNILEARIDTQIALMNFWIDSWIRLRRAMGMAGTGLLSGERAFISSSVSRDVGRHGSGGIARGAGPAIIEGEAEAKLDWARGVNDLNKQLHDDIIDAEADYGRQRADTIRNYQKGVAREERDFNRGRLRAELEHLDSIADVYKERARAESKAAADLARSNSQARADSDERIADARKDSVERLVELEEDYNKDRERALADHRDKLMSAAGRLDAIAILEERKRFARESKDAKDAHDEQRSDLQEQLDERIDDENQALVKSIRQAQEAHERQLAEGRENDRQRIEEMKADFTKRKAEEDADRAIRAGDRAQDHADQLAEMDRTHGERLNQIRTQALKERIQHDLDHEAEMVRLKAADAAMKARVLAREKVLTDSYDRYWDHVEKRMKALAEGTETTPRTLPGGPVQAFARGGPVASTGLAMLHAGEYVMPAPAASMMSAGNMTNSREITIGNIAVYGAPTDSPYDFASRIRDELILALEEVAA